MKKAPASMAGASIVRLGGIAIGLVVRPVARSGVQAKGELGFQRMKRRTNRATFGMKVGRSKRES